MKIAVASTGYDLNSDVSPIFGRNSAFVIADLEECEIKDMSIIKGPLKRIQTLCVCCYKIKDF
jgi:predicted Fe-Mo cluster-binding NifX family protein